MIPGGLIPRAGRPRCAEHGARCRGDKRDGSCRRTSIAAPVRRRGLVDQRGPAMASAAAATAGAVVAQRYDKWRSAARRWKRTAHAKSGSRLRRRRLATWSYAHRAEDAPCTIANAMLTYRGEPLALVRNPTRRWPTRARSASRATSASDFFLPPCSRPTPLAAAPPRSPPSAAEKPDERATPTALLPLHLRRLRGLTGSAARTPLPRRRGGVCEHHGRRCHWRRAYAMDFAAAQTVPAGADATSRLPAIRWWASRVRRRRTGACRSSELRPKLDLHVAGHLPGRRPLPSLTS